MLPTFIMPIGISGSGKSTTLQKFYKDFEIVSTDSLRMELTGNISDQSKNSEVYKIAHEKVIDLLTCGISTIFDATNVDHTGWIDFIMSLPPCKKIAMIFNTDPEVAYSRILSDISSGKNRSNVPKDVIYKQYELFKNMLKSKAIFKYFDEIYYVFNSQLL
jgi:predicted kinase